MAGSSAASISNQPRVTDTASTESSIPLKTLWKCVTKEPTTPKKRREKKAVWAKEKGSSEGRAARTAATLDEEKAAVCIIAKRQAREGKGREGAAEGARLRCFLPLFERILLVGM
jgi:hypothetical protein